MNETAPQDFYATEAGQFIANAYRYLSAAKTLRFPAGEEAGELLHLVPILHLMAHGTELLLKYPLLRSGQSQWQIRNTHGHNLASLWKAAGTAALRRMVLERAASTWAEARDGGEWPDDFSHDPAVVFEDAIQKLSYAHDRDSGFALRYTLPVPQLTTPRPAFLLQVLEPVAETLCKDPDHTERWIATAL